ncbi:hypothetical protein BpHYR1_012372 [Brachionus plicatilis]|uniref:Uncharacterized protein n=1 Tax=Brachionus plicatilis TaxID=10195 RepID=A0A3M7S1G2_BRAPC|nr:hypothetical protein BpHYR1_012372 [Brachionus plicatilis]
MSFKINICQNEIVFDKRIVKIKLEGCLKAKKRPTRQIKIDDPSLTLFDIGLGLLGFACLSMIANNDEQFGQKNKNLNKILK